MIDNPSSEPELDWQESFHALRRFRKMTVRTIIDHIATLAEAPISEKIQVMETLNKLFLNFDVPWIANIEIIATMELFDRARAMEMAAQLLNARESLKELDEWRKIAHLER